MFQHATKLFWVFAVIALCACSNSEGGFYAFTEDSIAGGDLQEAKTSAKIDYLPIYDSEYPYAGIPRIVIETENHQEIKDRETEIPAKLQIWGENSPESEVMDLTIRGRGNTTWSYPKKPYAIKFNEKQAFLGMPKAKKWVMLANYRDRTLIRNAVAFEIARQTNQAWVPQGKFADVYLNQKFIGNYYICEKIEVKEKRLNLKENSFLIEFDKYYDGDFKFRTEINDLPVIIKYPKEPDESEISNIKNFINSAEASLQQPSSDSSYLEYINQGSFADYIIIYALTTNTEPSEPKSVYMHLDKNGKINAGPVWDFDYSTFNKNKTGLANKNSKLFKQLLHKPSFKQNFTERWESDKKNLNTIYSFVDSLSNYIAKSNELNINLWPVKINVHKVGDEVKTFEESIDMLKHSLQKKTIELDSITKQF